MRDGGWIEKEGMSMRWFGRWWGGEGGSEGGLWDWSKVVMWEED